MSCRWWLLYTRQLVADPVPSWHPSATGASYSPSLCQPHQPGHSSSQKHELELKGSPDLQVLLHREPATAHTWGSQSFNSYDKSEPVTSWPSLPSSSHGKDHGPRASSSTFRVACIQGFQGETSPNNFETQSYPWLLYFQNSRWQKSPGTAFDNLWHM